jgi:hypothetical protein
MHGDVNSRKTKKMMARMPVISFIQIYVR